MTSPWSAKIPSRHRQQQQQKQKTEQTQTDCEESQTRRDRSQPLLCCASASLAYFLNNLAHKSFGAAAARLPGCHTSCNDRQQLVGIRIGIRTAAAAKGSKEGAAELPSRILRATTSCN